MIRAEMDQRPNACMELRVACSLQQAHCSASPSAAAWSFTLRRDQSRLSDTYGSKIVLNFAVNFALHFALGCWVQRQLQTQRAKGLRHDAAHKHSHAETGDLPRC